MKILKRIGIALLIIVLIIIVVLNYLTKRPVVQDDYITKVETGGDIEAKYMDKGEYQVAYFEKGYMHNFEKYEIYYPEDIMNSNKKYPVIIYSNGTGIQGSKYHAVLKHVASHGFIVMATEEKNSWNGFSSEMCLRTIISYNNTKEIEGVEVNPFYQHVDLDNIGVSGHSQGGVGVFNAVNENKHGYMIKTIYSASPTNLELAKALQWEYDPSIIHIPTLIISSTGKGDENLVISSKQLKELYDRIPNTTFKIMARRTNAGHGDMLYYGDGYMIAWFKWHLQGDLEAKKAFVGDKVELMNNPLYIDIQINGDS